MRNSRIANGENIYTQWGNASIADSAGSAQLQAHQQLGAIALPTNPTNNQTLTLTINGTAITVTFVSSIGSTAGNVLIAGTAALTAANLIGLLTNPGVTSSTQVALAANNQTLANYIDWHLVGTTITPCSLNSTNQASLTTFTASTTVTGGSYTAQTLELFVEPGVVYVNGTRVIFAGGSTPLVTAPVSNPRIDVLTIDSSGTLAWTTGAENASPTAPAYPINKMPICELYNVTSETVLVDNANQSSGKGYILNDVRPFLSFVPTWSAFGADIIPDADGTRNLGSVSKEWNNIYAKSGIFLNGVSINSQTTSSYTAGPSITQGQAVYVGPYQSDGGIKVDTSGNASNFTTGSITIGSNSNRGLLVFIQRSSNSGAAVSSITFNSVAGTLVQSQYASSSVLQAAYYFNAPATGSHTLSITLNSGNCNISWYSLYNVSQSGQPEASTAVTFNNSGGSTTQTTIANGAMVLTTTVFVNSPTGTATYENLQSTSGTENSWDSGQVFPGGSNVTLTHGTNAGTIAGVIMVSIAPFTTPVTAISPASSATPTSQFLNGYDTFIGFANANITGGQVGVVVTAGEANVLSGLTPGKKYYLNDSAGTVGSSPGTNTRKIGISTSATTMVIANII